MRRHSHTSQRVPGKDRVFRLMCPWEDNSERLQWPRSQPAGPAGQKMGNRASRTSPACPVGRAPMWPRGDINSLGRQPSRYLGCGCRAGSPSAPKYTEHPSPRAGQRQHAGQSPQASFGWCAPTHGGAIVRGRRHDSPRETGNPSRKQQAGEEAQEAKYWAIRPRRHPQWLVKRRWAAAGKGTSLKTASGCRGIRG